MKLENLEIVMHCLGMPFNGDSFAEKSLGGSETAAYCVAKQFAQLGNDVKLFTTHQTSTTETVGKGTLTCLFAGEVTEQQPLGVDFHYYATHTPHDLLLIQRHKTAFHNRFAAKMSFLWLHDLALPRDKRDIQLSAVNLDGVLVVSEYHKKQVCRVYGLPESFVHVFRNGVDHELVAEAEPLVARDNKQKRLLYVSRPERGLEHLVKKGGIMEQLPDYDLFVCTYNNVSRHLQGYYEHLWRRIEELPNCHNLGFLSKRDLYGAMKSADLLVYPTPNDLAPEFREVSCIAVMEAAHCGLPVVTSNKGALPETLKGAGAFLLDEVAEFAPTIQGILAEDQALYRDLVTCQKEAAMDMTWSRSVYDFENTLTAILSSKRALVSEDAVLKNEIKHSAISRLAPPMAFDQFIEDQKGADKGRIFNNLVAEIEECYQFYPNPTYKRHYDLYRELEARHGATLSCDDVNGNPRFETVASLIEDKFAKGALVPGDVILDYGCGHGHYTIALAQRFPRLKFFGVDITEENILFAKDWAAELDVQNVDFAVGEVECERQTFNCGVDYDHILCAEVLEHVRDPHALLNALKTNANVLEPWCFITTPYGPWEAETFKKYWPWRGHIHDFTKGAIRQLFGQQGDFSIQCVPARHGPFPEPKGSFVYGFRFETDIPALHTVQEHNKELKAHAAEQLVSLCMIVKDDWMNLAKCLDSVSTIVSEVVVRLDETGDNFTVKSILDGFAHQHNIPVYYWEGASPLVVGFDEARNDVISRAEGDWILWLDSDEQMVHPENLRKYLRHNLYNAYSIEQNHFSYDPAQVLKTDYPAKLFRSALGIKFFGRVHEHPELALNEGIGPVAIIPDVSIVHFGYDNEGVRRGRFVRNFDLLRRDRRDYPDRLLGKFFWLRDMAQFCEFSLEQGTPRERLAAQLAEGFAVWPEILESGNLRMITEAAKFYTMLVKASGKAGVFVNQNLGVASPVGEAELVVEGLFRTADEACEFLSVVCRLRIEALEEIPIVIDEAAGAARPVVEQSLCA